MSIILSTTSTSDSNTQIPMNLPSLCIPRVFANITQARIRSTIEALNLGEIERIDLVPGRDNNNTNQFQRVFIHFKKWNNESENACKARARILDNKEIKIIYDDPWFWKVSAYRPPQPTRPLPKKVPGPVIDFEFSSTGYQDTMRPRHDTRPRPRPRHDTRPDTMRPRQNQPSSHYQPQPESFYRPRSPIGLPPKISRKSGSRSDTDSESDASSFDSAVDAAVAAIATATTATATTATATTATAATATATTATAATAATATATATTATAATATAATTTATATTATATATTATATTATEIVVEKVAADPVVDQVKGDVATSIYPESTTAPRKRKVVIKKA
jgi:hypothetical protein